MNLVDAIEGNPNTKFILFHGGYPWVGETGVIVMRFRNVWVDACWLPTLSYTMAKRAFQEWLDAFPSDRIMWGADTHEGAGAVVGRARDAGLLLVTAGDHTLRFLPPLVATRDELGAGLEILDEVLRAGPA